MVIVTTFAKVLPFPTHGHILRKEE